MLKFGLDQYQEYLFRHKGSVKHMYECFFYIFK